MYFVHVLRSIFGRRNLFSAQKSFQEFILVPFFRIPIPDLRPSAAVDRSPWWIQRVRDDVLRLKLENVTFKTIFCENIAKSGNFVIEFSKGTGKKKIFGFSLF